MNYDVFASGPRKGQPKLVRDRIIRYLEDEMRMICVRKSSKRTIMRFNSIEKYIFVGTHGSARIGKNITHSQDCAEKIKVKMEKWESEKGLI